MFLRRTTESTAATAWRRRALILAATVSLTTAFVGTVATPAALAVGDAADRDHRSGPGQTDPASTGPIVFVVAFSEPVEGLVFSGVDFTGTTADGAPSATISGSGANYTVSVTGMSGPGDIVASIKPGAAWDIERHHEHRLHQHGQHGHLEPGLPTVTINQGAGQSDPTSTTPIVFGVVFSEPVTSFDGSDINFAGSTVGGTPSALVSGSGANYTVEVINMAGTAPSWRTSPPGAPLTPTAWETSRPPASTTRSPGSWDRPRRSPSTSTPPRPTRPPPPRSSSTSSSASRSPASTTSSVDFTGSTADNGVVFGTVSGSGAYYTVSVVGLTMAGTVVASIPAGAAHDADGQANAPSTSQDNTVLFDPSPPAVTINQGTAQADPTATSPIVFDVVFTEPVSGFTGADINLGASAAGGPLTAVVAGSGAVYTVTVTGMTTAGTVVATIVAGAAQDADGHANTLLHEPRQHRDVATCRGAGPRAAPTTESVQPGPRRVPERSLDRTLALRDLRAGSRRAPAASSGRRSHEPGAAPTTDQTVRNDVTRVPTAWSHAVPVRCMP